MDGLRHVQCVDGWLGLAWIRPRLVEFIACNLHNPISSRVFGDARCQNKVVLLGPREEEPAHLGTVCGAGQEPDRVQSLVKMYLPSLL